MNINVLAEQAGFELSVGLKLIVARDRDKRIVLVSDKLEKFAKLVEQEVEPKLSSNFQLVSTLALELHCKKGDLQLMRTQWEAGDSGSDPSDQFVLEQEIDELFERLKEALRG